MLRASSGCKAALWLIYIIIFDDPLSVLFLEHGDYGIVVPSQHCWIRLGIPLETLLAEYPKRDKVTV